MECKSKSRIFSIALISKSKIYRENKYEASTLNAYDYISPSFFEHYLLYGPFTLHQFRLKSIAAKDRWKHRIDIFSKWDVSYSERHSNIFLVLISA